MTIHIWLYLAIAIIALLTAIAGYYQWQLYRARQHMQALEASAKAAEAKHRAEINSSIQIISRAVVADQVGYVEASIRISGLMDQLGLSPSERQEFAVFDKMRDAVRHIPILDAWKELPRDQKLKFEREMQLREDELNDFILDAASRMLGKTW